LVFYNLSSSTSSYVSNVTIYSHRYYNNSRKSTISKNIFAPPSPRPWIANYVRDWISQPAFGMGLIITRGCRRGRGPSGHPQPPRPWGGVGRRWTGCGMRMIRPPFVRYFLGPAPWVGCCVRSLIGWLGLPPCVTGPGFGAGVGRRWTGEAGKNVEYRKDFKILRKFLNYLE